MYSQGSLAVVTTAVVLMCVTARTGGMSVRPSTFPSASTLRSSAPLSAASAPHTQASPVIVKGAKEGTSGATGAAEVHDEANAILAIGTVRGRRAATGGDGVAVTMKGEDSQQEPEETQEVNEVDESDPEYRLLKCLVEKARKSETQRRKTKRKPKMCPGGGILQKSGGGEGTEECLPSLLLVFPTLCNDTKLCVNVTEASLDNILHRHWLWKRKNKRREESQEAVVYIVVVLAFYSFGIVFMMANFIRQEQREIEETKLYKQYIKVARDRWLTTRGNLANKLALQALNTLNAVPQTTNVNKVTFV